MNFNAIFHDFWNEILRENFKKSLENAVKILDFRKNPVILWVAPEGHTFYNIQVNHYVKLGEN